MVVGDSTQQRVRRFLRRSQLEDGAISWFWPGISLSVLEDVRAVAKMITNLLVGAFGLLLMLASFFTKGMRPAFSQSGPWVPITTTGRVVLFVGGALVLFVGVSRLFR